MAEPFVGQIICLACNFAPVGWLYCNGQLISISQYGALYNLLGTTYGGDGQTTFGVPDLRGRAPVHFGQGPGLPNYVQGQMAGSMNVSLTASTMPAHQHMLVGVSAAGDAAVPAANTLLSDEGPAGVPVPAYHAYDAGAQVSLTVGSVSLAGAGAGHENRQPFQALTFAIATEGIYPSQN